MSRHRYCSKELNIRPAKRYRQCLYFIKRAEQEASWWVRRHTPPTIWQNLVLFGVFVHFSPGCRRSKCWRQIICKHTHRDIHVAHALLSPEVGNFRPLYTHYLSWPFTPDLWPSGWSKLFASAFSLVSLTVFVLQAALLLGVCEQKEMKMMETLRLGAGDGTSRQNVRNVERRLNADEEGRRKD